MAPRFCQLASGVCLGGMPKLLHLQPGAHRLRELAASGTKPLDVAGAAVGPPEGAGTKPIGATDLSAANGGGLGGGRGPLDGQGRLPLVPLNTNNISLLHLRPRLEVAISTLPLRASSTFEQRRYISFTLKGGLRILVPPPEFWPKDNMAKQTTIKEFEAVFPKLQDDVLSWAKQYNLPQQQLDWYKAALENNAYGGKCNRGMSVPDSVSILINKPLSEDEYFKAATLGWMIELLQAFFLVSDDMMDGSITRRGKPCWYRQEGVGMIAINDAFLLESAIYTLLKKYFKTHPAYVDIMELFHEVTLQTELGQLCDLLTAPEDVVNLDNFSLEKYTFIVIYKTAYYSFYLPVALALHMLNIATPKNLKQAEDILIPMGEYFQVQDDYLDNFGLPEHIGKIGTDIQDNKCSWLVNQALRLATPEQRKVLEEHYGKKDKAHEAEIKKLYDEMKLEQVYQEYEEKIVGEIRTKISQVDEADGLKKSVFYAFLSKIYKRSK
ncbi:Uu.00g084300.m01.CDS01 [Anthostomella pinea]|uniref:Uu.00g084300.m01.CDS01 n=1 Tax=Anthostomella pinea TaxID=933095 RepID=A0AAI8YHA3_9PEZI|nr:Uu.00g084300.m01.CDS01 [Anthostomella pinea]